MHIKTSPVMRAIIGYMLALALVFAIVPTTFAQGYYGGYGRGYDYGYRYHSPYGAGPRLTAAQADSIALSRFPGRLTGVTRLITVGNRLAYQVHIRQGNLRRIVAVDARSGRIDLVQTRTVPPRGYRY